MVIVEIFGGSKLNTESQMCCSYDIKVDEFRVCLLLLNSFSIIINEMISIEIPNIINNIIDLSNEVSASLMDPKSVSSVRKIHRQLLLDISA